MKKNILILALAFSGLMANAQTYLMDRFNYTNDTLVNSGWTQIGTTATTPLVANSTPLTFTGYVESGNGKSVVVNNAGQDIFRDITLTSGMNTGEVYVSFMANVSAAQAAGDYFFALLPSGNTSNYMARTYIASSSTGYYKVAINRWTEARAYSADSFAYNATHLFVIRYVFNTTTSNTDDSVYMYVFKPGQGVPATMPANPTAFCSNATGNMTGPQIGRVALRQGTSANAPTLTIGGLRFAVNWGDGPLPVSMKGFSGNFEDGKVLLNWATASETNNSGFTVERSADGIEFESLGFVKGNGNSNRTLNYAFEDRNPLAVNYYRLAQSDFDGTIHYSEVIKVVEVGAEIEISPNPFENEVLVTVGSEIPVSAEIFDIQGKRKAVATGMGTVSLDTKALESGIYFVRVNTGNETRVQRIVRN